MCLAARFCARAHTHTHTQTPLPSSVLYANAGDLFPLRHLSLSSLTTPSHLHLYIFTIARHSNQPADIGVRNYDSSALERFLSYLKVPSTQSVLSGNKPPHLRSTDHANVITTSVSTPPPSSALLPAHPPLLLPCLPLVAPFLPCQTRGSTPLSSGSATVPGPDEQVGWQPPVLGPLCGVMHRGLCATSSIAANAAWAGGLDCHEVSECCKCAKSVCVCMCQ